MSDLGEDRWLTFAELGAALGCSASAARSRAQRAGWPRRAANTVGGFTLVLVPENLDLSGKRPPPARRIVSAGNGAALDNGAASPPAAALEAAVAALTEQLRAANERLASADRRADDLARALAEANRRFLDALTGPRIPWWRRWFR